MIELNVPDMTCGHCASSITRAVKEIDSRGTCEVDLRAHKVRIGSDRPAEAFIAAITEAGYTPTLAARP